MKTLGLIGGMSWESTLSYYRLINQRVATRLGGLHSARLILYSVDFDDIARCQRDGDWQTAGGVLAEAALALQRAGADGLLLCTNTMHKVADAISSASSLPLLHIADPTAQAVLQAGIRQVGLLGTRFTMEQPFYRQRLEQVHGLRVLVPEAEDRDLVHQVIYDELCCGHINAESRASYRRIIQSLVSAGAEAIILGCTEIGLLISASDCAVPLFDTTALHASAAVDWALGLPAAVDR